MEEVRMGVVKRMGAENEMGEEAGDEMEDGSEKAAAEGDGKNEGLAFVVRFRTLRASSSTIAPTGSNLPGEKEGQEMSTRFLRPRSSPVESPLVLER
jgi:hypothetical protein